MSKITEVQKNTHAKITTFTVLPTLVLWLWPYKHLLFGHMNETTVLAAKNEHDFRLI